MGKKFKEAWKRFMNSSHNFVFGGEEVSMGDCTDLSLQAVMYVLLVWLMTFDKWGAPMFLCLIPIVFCLYLIWNAYFKYKKKIIAEEAEKEVK
jgi:hypothetical protein